MFPYKKVIQILLLVVMIVLVIRLVIDAVRQYKYFMSQQYLIDAAHENLVPITVHSIGVRNINPPRTWSDPSFDSLIIDVKKSMQNRSRQEGTVLNASYNLSIPRKYIFKIKKSVGELFDLMLDNRNELEKLCTDGIHRLEGYITYGYGLNSLIQVAGIIKGFSKLFDNIRPKESWILDGAGKKYWFKFIVYLSRLLTMYQFIGNDKTIKNTCGKLIGKIISKIDQVMGWKLQGPETVFIAVPWLLNLLHSKNLVFFSEINSQKFKELRPYLEHLPGNDLMVFEGFYKNLYYTFANYATV